MTTTKNQHKTTDIEALDFVTNNNLESYSLYTVIDPSTGEYYITLEY